jgi:hypothetical protein
MEELANWIVTANVHLAKLTSKVSDHLGEEETITMEILINVDVVIKCFAVATPNFKLPLRDVIMNHGMLSSEFL